MQSLACLEIWLQFIKFTWGSSAYSPGVDAYDHYNYKQAMMAKASENNSVGKWMCVKYFVGICLVTIMHKSL